MTLSEDVNLEEYVMAKDDLSGADIKVGSQYQFYCVTLPCSRVHEVSSLQQIPPGQNWKTYWRLIPTADTQLVSQCLASPC